MNQKVLTATYILTSVGLTCLAIALWNYEAEEESKVANAALDISYDVETPDNWSGRQKPDFNVSANPVQFEFPPPDGDDDGGDGDSN